MRLENNGRSRRGLFRLALDAVTSSLVVATAAGAARAQNTIIARLMDAGRPIEGRVQFIGAERESRWVDIGMTIVLRG